MRSSHVLRGSRWSNRPAEMASRPPGHGTGHGDEGRAHEAPTHPSSQAPYTMIPATIEAEAAVPPTDAPLDTHTKPQPGSVEPFWRRA
jgi:hypothetical protein